LAASICLPVGAAFGVLLARWPAADLFGRLLLSHTVTMLLGWVGLTVMGTLVTFWPTLLRTRVHPLVARRTQQALPVLLAGIALVDAGALADLRWLAVTGLTVHLAATVWWGEHPPAARPRRPAAAGSGSLRGLGAGVGAGPARVPHPPCRTGGLVGAPGGRLPAAHDHRGPGLRPPAADRCALTAGPDRAGRRPRRARRRRPRVRPPDARALGAAQRRPPRRAPAGSGRRAPHRAGHRHGDRPDAGPAPAA